jgi:hypothetical protein
VVCFHCHIIKARIIGERAKMKGKLTFMSGAIGSNSPQGLTTYSKSFCVPEFAAIF